MIGSFSTDRCLVGHWRPVIGDPVARRTLETSLTAILSPAVLAHLPEALHLEPAEGAVSSWVEARAAECDVLTVRSRAGKALIGLVILASAPDEQAEPTIRLGYLFAESVWGQGVASEVLNGLVSCLRTAAPTRLVGGVDKSNPASARVLQKAGFVVDTGLSTPDSETYVLRLD